MPGFFPSISFPRVGIKLEACRQSHCIMKSYSERNYRAKPLSVYNLELPCLSYKIEGKRSHSLNTSRASRSTSSNLYIQRTPGKGICAYVSCNAD